MACMDTSAIRALSPWRRQVFGEAAEAGHVRQRPDPTDLHAARLVPEKDSGAAAVLRRQEEPRGNEDQPDLQQGQLCLKGAGLKGLQKEQFDMFAFVSLRTR